MFGHNLLQILGARLSGIGKSRIDTMNTILGLSPTPSKRSFLQAQKYLSKVCTEIAVRSCNRAFEELRRLHNTPGEEFLEIAVSYDGAYQKREGRSGGGFARYCFSAAIPVQTGKVLTYEIAC